ncbi:ABC transporter permease [Stutzerimonas azotifigens]|uniref:ABC transporter permease n=1 Tax=Stutzerimonas azotifigens TaxID=291995 RepID=UPI0003FDD990|nr:ABC transporter permease subunit [Stutzerimonas azotifigens]
MSAQAILQRLGAPLTVLVLLTLWELAARALALDGFPTATESLAQLPAILFDGQSLQSIGASLARMFAGIGLALLVAVPAGLAMGRNPTLARMLNPLLSAAYPVPKAALMPMVMLWFGVGDLSKILVIFLGVSLPLLYHSYHGAARLDDKLLWSAAAMGMRAPARLLRITLPGALPEVLLGCRVGLAMALIVMISSEMIARQSGAGDLLFNALDMALYPDVYAMIVILAALGFALDWAFEHLRLRLVHWAEPRQDAASGGNS